MTAERSGLILDFGGVITTDFYGALSSFCTREGLPSDALRAALRDTEEGRQALAAAETGASSQRAFELSLARLLGLDDRDLLRRVLADLQPYQPALDLVEQVRARGVATAILSNSWGSGAYDPYDGYDLEARFDVVVISDRVGLRKPDPAIYALTADMIGVRAEQCVFVDDTAHNLPPAQAAGMQVVLFDEPVAATAEIRQMLSLD